MVKKVEKDVEKAPKTLDKKAVNYQENWERLNKALEDAEAELKAANDKRIDAFVKKYGLPPKDAAKLEKLLFVYGFDGIYGEIEKIAAKHGLEVSGGEPIEEDELEDDEELDDDDEEEEPEEEPEPPKRKPGRPKKNPVPEPVEKPKAHVHRRK